MSDQYAGQVERNVSRKAAIDKIVARAVSDLKQKEDDDARQAADRAAEQAKADYIARYEKETGRRLNERPDVTNAYKELLKAIFKEE